MKGINKAIILGNLGADPQQVTFQDGSMIANLSIATSENWTDRNGNPQENTQWHKVRLSGKLAELGIRLLTKVSQVYIEGQIKTRKWVDKNNQTQYTTEIYAEKFELLSGEKSPGAIPKSHPNIQSEIQTLPQHKNSSISSNNSDDSNWIPF